MTLMAMLTAVAAPVATAEARQATRVEVVIRSAYDQGYRDGLRVGIDDAQRGQTFNFTVRSEYRRGDDGYRSSLGDRDQYREDFRVGFERGYREAFDRFDVSAPPRNEAGVPGRDVRDLAAATGYSDGYKEGLSDGHHRHRNDPYSERRFRSGDHGYSHEYGNRETYRSRYREAFRDGYERGYAAGFDRDR